MLSKQLTIRVNKCVLVLSETELMSALAAKPEIFQKAIKRGKGLIRAKNVERRENQVDRWMVYEWLRGNRIPDNAASLIGSMGITELREGVCEHFLTILHVNRQDSKLMIGG